MSKRSVKIERHSDEFGKLLRSADIENSLREYGNGVKASLMGSNEGKGHAWTVSIEKDEYFKDGRSVAKIQTNDDAEGAFWTLVKSGKAQQIIVDGMR